MNNPYIADVTHKINKFLTGCPLALKPVMEHLKTGGGKNIRAAVVLETARALGEINDRIISLAAAVEILHLATLVHDDIIDKSKIRRGAVSVYGKFGSKTAVLAGDFLFTKCFSLAANNNQHRIGEFSAAVANICAGEILQNQNNHNYNLNERQYYKIIAGKTAAMFALAMGGAAYETLGEATDENRLAVRRLGMAGYYLGMTFQMIDDCLDYEAGKSKIKKPALKDLGEGVVTYPLIYAMKINPAVNRLLSQKRTLQNKKAVASEVLNCGGVEHTRKQAKIFYDRAAEKISLALSGKNCGGLLNILDTAYYRES